MKNIKLEGWWNIKTLLKNYKQIMLWTSKKMMKIIYILNVFY